MVGDVYDYNEDRIYVMSGEKRIIITFKEGELEYWRTHGLMFNKGVIFDYENKKIVKFL